MVVLEVAGEKFSVDNGLYKNWSKIKDGKLAQLDEDRVYIVDGREGSGKSLWAMQQAAAIDPKLFEDAVATKTLPRICFDGEQTLHAIRNTKSTKSHTKVIIFDEAFRGLASTSVLSKINRQIIQVLMEMRQNNLVLFIILPSFIMLDKYALMNRGNALFHIHKPKTREGKKSYHRKFYVYNYAQKGILAQMDKKRSWSYPIRSRVHGNFYNKYPGGKVFEQLYRDEKQRAFREVGKKLQGETEDTKYIVQRNLLLLYLKDKCEEKWTHVSKHLDYEGIRLAPNTMSTAYKSAQKWLTSHKTVQITPLK